MTEPAVAAAEATVTAEATVAAAETGGSRRTATAAWEAAAVVALVTGEPAATGT